jgi:hypothetical protein
MAEEIIKKPGRDLGLLILFLIILGVLWYAQGGADRQFSTGPFLTNTPAPTVKKDTIFFDGENFEGIDAGVGSQSGAVSFYARQAKQSDPQKEYLEIELSKEGENLINITGWTVGGRIGLDLKIPKAAHLFIANQVNVKQNVFLSPGGKAVIATGRSPIGSSFRLNKCTGYFSQFQDFFPRLLKKCPYPRDEEWPANLSDDCLDYIETLPRCQANFSIPVYLGNKCIKAINKQLSYNSCVAAHKSDEDFYKNEWRIYLNRDEELWKNRHDTIILRNKEGKIVDSVFY